METQSIVIGTLFSVVELEIGRESEIYRVYSRYDLDRYVIDYCNHRTFFSDESTVSNAFSCWTTILLLLLLHGRNPLI